MTERTNPSSVFITACYQHHQETTDDLQVLPFLLPSPLLAFLFPSLNVFFNCYKICLSVSSSSVSTVPFPLPPLGRPVTLSPCPPQERERNVEDEETNLSMSPELNIHHQKPPLTFTRQLLYQLPTIDGQPSVALAAAAASSSPAPPWHIPSHDATFLHCSRTGSGKFVNQSIFEIHK